MENLTAITVPVIVSVVYALIGVITKATNESEKFKRFIPLLALIFGAVLGGVLFVFEPSLIGANNAVVAIFIGAASGLAATGTDQIFKQLGKGKNSKADNDENKGE